MNHHLKKDAAPLGMTPVVFATEFRRFYLFEKAKQLPPIKKEQLFIQLLESIHPSEAKILCAVKDQTINKLYPSITYDVLAKYGYLPEQVKNEATEKEFFTKKS